MRCDECFYWKKCFSKSIKDDDDYLGVCHRYPPIDGMYTDETTNECFFPAVHGNGWCGEWKKIIEEEE